MIDPKLPALGPQAFNIDPHTLTTWAGSLTDEDQSDLAHDFAYDLATILNLPLANVESMPELERHVEPTLLNILFDN